MKEYLLIGGPYHLNKINLLVDISYTTLTDEGIAYPYSRRAIYVNRELVIVYAYGEIDIDELYKLQCKGVLK